EHPGKHWLINTDLDATSGYGYGTNVSPRNHLAFLVKPQLHVIDAANPGGALDDGVENRLHVGGRAADDAEHLRCCRLMLQGLAQFCVALLDFLEEPHVFDGNYRLVGKGFEKRDLLVGEWTDFCSANDNCSDR